jgi:hypothetical protein
VKERGKDGGWKGQSGTSIEVRMMCAASALLRGTGIDEDGMEQ